MCSKTWEIGLQTKEDKGELKTIYMFLFTTDEERFKLTDPNHPEACWVRRDEVVALLTHPKDKVFFKSVLHQIP